MTRGNFFKSLLTLVVAPKIVTEIDFSKLSSANTANLVSLNGNLVRDLQLLTPMYYKKLVEKYGDETLLLENLLP